MKLIKEFEGCYLKAYKCPAGIWTIGFGTTNSDKSITGFTVSEGKSISRAQAEDFLTKTLNTRYVPNVNKYQSKYKFNQNQFDALVSFCYNVGSIDQLVGNGKYSINTIASRILLFNHANGKVLSGLTRRRKAEQDLFLKEIAKNTKSSDVNNTTKTNASNYTVICNSLYIRKGPGKKYKIVGVLHKNDKVSIDSINGSWGRIYNSDNYISMAYVKKETTSSKKNSVTTYIINCNSLNIRSGPSTSYKSVGLLHKNDKVSVCEKRGNWCRISNTNKWFNVNYAKKI